MTNDPAGGDCWLTRGDVLSVLVDIERGIENTKAAMGQGDDRDRHLNDTFRRGKLQAYQYAKQQLLAMANWKGMELP